MGTKAESDTETGMKPAFHPGYATKVFFISTGGAVVGILLSILISWYGLEQMVERAGNDVHRNLRQLTREHLQESLEQINKAAQEWLNASQRELLILGKVIQTVMDQRDTLYPLLQKISRHPVFRNRLIYLPKEGMYQSKRGEPTNIILQRFMLSPEGTIEPEVKKLIEDTAWLDLVMPPFHTMGSTNQAVYVIGPDSLSFSRIVPNYDVKSMLELYPDFPDISYWDYTPGLLEDWERYRKENPELLFQDFLTGFPAHLDGATGNLVRSCGLPLWDREQKEIVLTVWFDQNIQDLVEILNGFSSLKSSIPFLVTDRGYVMGISDHGLDILGMSDSVSMDDEQNYQCRLSDSEYPSIRNLTLPSDATRTIQTVDLNGVAYTVSLMGLRPILSWEHGGKGLSKGSWAIGMLSPLEELYHLEIQTHAAIDAQKRRILFAQLVVFIVLIGVLSLLAWWFMRGLNQRLSALTGLAGEIRKGDFSHRLDPGPADDIGMLGRAFNEMSERLEHKAAEVAQQTQTMEKVIQEKEEAQNSLQRHLEVEEAIVSISRYLVSDRDVDTRLLLSTLVQVSSADCGLILRHIPEDSPVPLSRVEWYCPLLMDRQLPQLSAETVNILIRESENQEKLVLRDVHSWRAVSREFSGLNEAMGLHAWLLVPVRSAHHAFGAVGIASSSKNPDWNRLEHHLLVVIAEMFSKDLERRLTNRRLRDSENRYRTIIDNSQEGIFILREGRFHFLNRRFASMLGYPDEQSLQGRSLAQRVHLDDRPMLARFMLDIDSGRLTPPPLECKLISRDGDLVEVELIGNSIVIDGNRDIQCMVRDLSQLKRLENQLRQSAKMDAVGQLAGGIAHDFNNIITIINGYAGMLHDTVKSDQAKADLLEIVEAGNRAGKLTRQLLNFSRRDEQPPRVIDVNLVLRDIQRMLGRLLPEDIDFIIEPHPESIVIKADPGRLEQVFMNLIVNARDAIEKRSEKEGPRRITIRISPKNVDAGQGRKLELATGSYCMIEVIDTGTGIEEDIRERIFEPFFTTKDRDSGTGLGLAVIYGIVHQNDGNLYVESDTGVGTTFRILWPLASESLPETDFALPRLIQGQNEKVLIVEDDVSVRHLAERVLSGNGYNTLIAENGFDALELAAENRDIDLLLTDVIMPGLDGVKLAGKMKTIIPDIRIVYFSGYTNSVLEAKGLNPETSHFVNKPFSVPDLLRTIADALSGLPVERK